MMRELATPGWQKQDFMAALYQFLLPTVTISPDGTHQRLPGLSLLHQLDEALLLQLDAPHQEPLAPVRIGLRPGMCKNIGPVQRPTLPSSSQPAPAQRPPPRAPFVPKPSSSTARRKRTRRTEGNVGPSRQRTSKRKYFDSLKKKRESTLF